MKLSFAIGLIFLSANAFAGISKSLPAVDRLAKVTSAVGSQLNDNNIAGGVTQLWAAQLVETRALDRKQLEALTLQGFQEAYESHDLALPDGVQIKLNVRAFQDGDGKNSTVSKMTSAILESNDYDPSNEETWEAHRKYVWSVLRRLPVDASTIVGRVQAKLYNETKEATVSVQYFLVIGADRKIVQLFTEQGSM